MCIQMYEIHMAVAAIRVQGKTFADICSKIPIADIFHTRRRREAILPEPEVDFPAISNASEWRANSTANKDDHGPVLDAAEALGENKTAVESQSAVVAKSAVAEKSAISEDHYDSLWADYDYDEEIKAQADTARSQVRIDYEKYGMKKAGEKRLEDEKVELPDDIYCDLVNTLDDKCLEASLLSIWKYNRFVLRETSMYCSTADGFVNDKGL